MKVAGSAPRQIRFADRGACSVIERFLPGLSGHARRSEAWMRLLEAIPRMCALAVLIAAFSASLWWPGSRLQAQEDTAEVATAREVRRVVHDASRALQARNASLFLQGFDRKQFAGYADLESHIVALTMQSDIASSIEIVAIEPKDGGYHLRVDWLLQLSVLETPGPLETRREVLEISAAQQKGKWRITDLRPVRFFRPQGAERVPKP
jgi:hypothetical protein